MSHLSTPLETLYPSIGSPSIKTWATPCPQLAVYSSSEIQKKNPLFQDITE